MSLGTNDLIVRPIAGSEELGLFTRLRYGLDEELAGDLAGGRRRPGWMWVALRGGRVVARAAWWSRAAGDAPLLLDVLDVDDGAPAADRVDVGVRLVRAALADLVPSGAVPPEYSRFVPTGWRESPATRRAVEDRMAVLERTGARPFVERRCLEWRPEAGTPGPSGRLAFRPVADVDELVRLMASVLGGTLDAHGQDTLARMPARDAAVTHYVGELARYPSPRDWWRVAALPDGEPVGFVVPAHNDHDPIIAYLGVVPEHRGKGYIDDVLAEGTRVLAAQGAPRIRATTDLGNVPMADAFHRAGYATTDHEITMTWR